MEMEEGSATTGVSSTAEAMGPAADARVPPLLAAVLRRFPVLRREPHLVTVHFPLVFAMTIPLFDVLSVVFRKRPAFERTAFYLTVLGVLATPVAIMTGFYTWWLNFKARPTSPIKVKIAVSLLLLADLLALLAWRLADPDITKAPGASRAAYLALSLMLPAPAAVLGRFGGRLAGHR
jgi:uncharacterized membrane protein